MNLKKLPKKLVLQGGTILDPLSGRSKKGNVVIEQNKIKSIVIDKNNYVYEMGSPR